MLSNIGLKFQDKILIFSKVLPSLSEKRIKMFSSQKCRFFMNNIKN